MIEVIVLTKESEVVAKFATTTRHGAIEGKTQTHLTEYYNLDMIISVGYRVKSKRGVEFRRWANNVLKQYVLQGYVCSAALLYRVNQSFAHSKRVEIFLSEEDKRSPLTSFSGWEIIPKRKRK